MITRVRVRHFGASALDADVAAGKAIQRIGAFGTADPVTPPLCVFTTGRHLIAAARSGRHRRSKMPRSPAAGRPETVT
jgi:hypothetical protein